MSDDAPRGNPGVDPDDLDISKSEYVRELGDDRYVVSPGRRQPQRPLEGGRADESPTEPDTDDAGDGEATSPDVALTAEAVREGLDPEAGPGTADMSRSSPQRSSPSAERSDGAANSPTGGPTDSVGAPASKTGASADPTPEPANGPAGGDDGLPGDPTAAERRTGGDRTASTEAADAPDRPASHARRGAPHGVAPASQTDFDAGAVGEWLAASLADTEFAYGFDATLSLDGRTTRHRMASDDVGETFETLVTWFADAAGGDTATEDALGILLAGMDTAPRLPPNVVRSALAGLGLSRDDSVEDVLAALEEADGLRLE